LDNNIINVPKSITNALSIKGNPFQGGGRKNGEGIEMKQMKMCYILPDDLDEYEASLIKADIRAFYNKIDEKIERLRAIHPSQESPLYPSQIPASIEAHPVRREG
jgi:hypothetical protein